MLSQLWLKTLLTSEAQDVHLFTTLTLTGNVTLLPHYIWGKKEANFQTSHIRKQDLMGPFQHRIFCDAITA